MNTTIDRNIILDLLPAYVGGEASKETCALVEEFAKHDPQIARLLSAGSLAELGGANLPQKSTVEMDALKRVKRRVSKQSWHFGFAIFFSLLTVTYQIGDQGVRWTWSEYPWVAVLCGAVALFFWLAYAESRKRVRSLL